jgi:hypothetical protein
MSSIISARIGKSNRTCDTLGPSYSGSCLISRGSNAELKVLDESQPEQVLFTNLHLSIQGQANVLA